MQRRIFEVVCVQAKVVRRVVHILMCRGGTYLVVIRREGCLYVEVGESDVG